MRYFLFVVVHLLPALAVAQSSVSSSTYSSLENNMGSEAYVADNLPLFEERAQQKTSDLFDYFELVVKSNSSKLKGHTWRMIGKQFASDSCRMYSLAVPTTSMPLSQLLKEKQLPEFWPASAQTLAFTGMREALHLTNEGHFEGVLSFSLQPKGSYYAATTQHTVGVVIQRSTKKFGSSSANVWEVYLCDVDAPWHATE